MKVFTCYAGDKKPTSNLLVGKNSLHAAQAYSKNNDAENF